MTAKRKEPDSSNGSGRSKMSAACFRRLLAELVEDDDTVVELCGEARLHCGIEDEDEDADRETNGKIRDELVRLVLERLKACSSCTCLYTCLCTCLCICLYT